MDKATDEYQHELEEKRPLEKMQAETTAAVLYDTDTELLQCTLPRLKQVHAAFYTEYRKQGTSHVTQHIHALRSTVLKGVFIVFSGCFPMTMSLHQTDPYKMATWLGARCYQQLTDDVTHVVATSPTTAKAREALRSGMVLVKDTWLKACAEQWTHLDESEYSFPPDQLVQEETPPKKKIRVEEMDRADIDAILWGDDDELDEEEEEDSVQGGDTIQKEWDELDQELDSLL